MGLKARIDRLEREQVCGNRHMWVIKGPHLQSPDYVKDLGIKTGGNDLIVYIRSYANEPLNLLSVCKI